MAITIGRRQFITLLAGAATWPMVARAQQSAMPVIGWLSSTSRSNIGTAEVAAFQRGLNQLGYYEGRNLEVEYRWAEGQYERLPGFADELIKRHVAVISGMGSVPAALAAKAATATIPLVFAIGADPVKSGLVASLSRPGMNITGATAMLNALTAKRLEVLRELVAGCELVGFLVNPANPIAQSDTDDMRQAAQALGLRLRIATASTPEELTTAFADLAKDKVQALIVGADSMFAGRFDQVVALAARQALPASYPYREYVAAGGLTSYAADRVQPFYEAGMYTGRILNGEKPGDLPVLQPTKFELVINLKTAKALGLAIPESLLLRADEVIE